jgi:hypothetical protein
MMPSEDVYGTEELRPSPFAEKEMPNGYYTTRNLPFLRNFSTQDRELAQKALSDQEERRRKANESRSQKADELTEGLRRQLHDLLGAQKLAQLREAMKQERLRFHDLWQPPVDLDLDYREQNKVRKQRLNALVRKLGTSPDKLREIGGEYENELREILTEPMARWYRAITCQRTSTNGRACLHCIRIHYPGERSRQRRIRLTLTGGSCSGHRFSGSSSASFPKPPGASG